MENGLETAQEEKKKVVRKEYSAEEIANIRAAAETLKSIGISADLEKVVDAAKDWMDKNAQADAKKRVLEAFGSPENLRAYLEGNFGTEFAALAGLRGLLTSINALAGYYKRREVTPKKRVKYVQISINGKLYSVNKDYMASIADKSRDERKELLLNHEDTKEFQPVCAEQF